jgi:hypothetical protein
MTTTAAEFLDAPDAEAADAPSAGDFLDAPYGDPDAPSMGAPRPRGILDGVWSGVRNSGPMTALLGKSAARREQDAATLSAAGVDPATRIPNRMDDEGLKGALLNPFAGRIPRMGQAETLPGKVGAGVVNAAAGLTESLVSPVALLSGGIGAGAGAAARGEAVLANPAVAEAVRDVMQAERGAAGVFAADMAMQAPGQIGAAYDAATSGDVQGAVEGTLGAAANLAFAGMAGRHAMEPARARMGKMAAEMVGEQTAAGFLDRPDAPLPDRAPAIVSTAERTTSQDRGFLAPAGDRSTVLGTAREVSRQADPQKPSTDVPTSDAVPERAAETITGPDEGIASVMPAEGEEPPMPAPVRKGGFQPKLRPDFPTLVSMLKGNGGKIDLNEIRKEIPGWKPPPSLRRHFTTGSGRKWDEVAAEAVKTGVLKGDPKDAAEFAQVLERHWEIYKGGATGESPTKAIDVEAKRYEQFQSTIVGGQFPKATAEDHAPVGIDGLNKGDRFKADGHKFEVVDVLADPENDGAVSEVTLKDGPKFGVQKVRADQGQVYVEKGSLKQASPPPDDFGFGAPEPIADPAVKAADPIFGAPESVPEQQARLEAEAAQALRKQQRQALVEGAAKPLVGRPVDTTGDMFDPNKADAPLFALRTPSGNASVGQYASGHPVTLGHLDALRPVQAPELVRLAQDLSFAVNAKKMSSEKRGLFTGGSIKLNRELFTLGNEQQLAATLAHEIGHGFDFLPDRTMDRGNILGRVATLREFMFATLPENPFQSIETILKPEDRAALRKQAEAAAGPRPKSAEARQEWQKAVNVDYHARVEQEIVDRGLVKHADVYNELWKLSQEWRPVGEGAPESFLRYRKSSKEVYADAISVLLNNPGMLEAKAPKFYKLFFDYLDRKPEVKRSYLELQSLLRGGEEFVGKDRRDRTVEGFIKAEESLKDALAQDRDAVDHPHGFRARVMQENVDRGNHIGKGIDKLRAQGVKISPDLDPRVAWEEANWAETEHALTADKVFRAVVDPLAKSGLDLRTLGELLKYERISGGLGARAILQMRLDELGPRGYERIKVQAKAMADAMAKGADPNELKMEMELKGLPADLIDEVRQNRLDSGTRAEIANPAAETQDSIQVSLRNMEASLGPEKWATLKRAANDFREIVYAKMKEGVETGIINRRTFDTTITANKDWYSTFRGLDHVDEHVTPFIRQAVGSLGDIENPFTTTMLKMLSMNNVMLRNRAKLLTRDTWTQHFPGEFKKAETFHNGSELKIKAPKDGFARLEIWENGRKVAYDVDPYIAQAFDQMTPAHVGAVTKTLDTFFKGVYPLIIKYNPAFQLWTNPVRDFGRTSRNLRAIRGKGGSVALAREYFAAWDTAKKFVAGDLSDPVARAMMEAKAIGVPMEGFGQSAGEQAGLKEILESYRLLTPKETSAWKRRAMAIPHWIQKIGARFEALPKVAAYRVLARDGLGPREAATEIRRYVGTPDYKIKGTHGAVHNVIVPFLNIFLQGYRGDLALATRPTTRGGYWMHYLMHDGGRAMLQGAAAAGVFGLAIKQAYDAASEYDKSTYEVIPLGYVAGGEHGRKGIYLRLPRDEASRVMSAAVYKSTRLAAEAAMGQSVKPSRVVNDVVASVVGVVPTPNPMISLLGGWADYLRGVPPIDGFRNRPVVPPRAWSAGGWAAVKPMITWSLGKTGGLNLVTYNSEADTTTEAVVTGLPILKSLLKVSDYGYTEQQRDQSGEKAKGRAQQRIQYADEVVSLQVQHDRLQALGRNRTPEQHQRYFQLHAWDQLYRRMDERIIQAKEAGRTDTAKTLTAVLNERGKAIKAVIDQRKAAAGGLQPVWAP